MEGAGEGMVAIVQGLRDAGLAVTLMDGRYRNLGRNAESARPKIPGMKTFNRVPLSKSSVETSTRSVNKICNGTQICDGRYASSYQLAHCSARPSSPPVHLAEFPPQRTSPCRNVCSSRSSRGTDPFVHSLRKYPSLTPDRSVSTELVQRLLSYTQAKNFGKCYSKSMRSLLKEKSTTIRNEKLKAKSSKNIQTYTRSKTRAAKGISPNTYNDIRVSFEDKSKPNKKNASNNISSMVNQLNATYDYLKSSSSPRRHPVGRSTEVRYLNAVTRCIRDTIKQMYDDKPVVCPNIRGRYARHVRQCHKDSTKDSACQQPCPARPKLCYYCREPTPCACNPSTSAGVQIPKHKDVNQVRCHCKGNMNDTNAFEALTCDLLKEVPVYANDSPNDKAKREEMIKGLVSTLKEIADDQNYEETARKEVKKCLAALPMWCPAGERNQELFRDQIADNLLNKFNLSKRISRKKSNTSAELLEDEVVIQKIKPSDLQNDSLKSIDFKQSLKEEVSDVLDKHNINNKELEENIASILADQVTRGGVDRKSMDQLYHILQDSNISEQEAEEITNNLIGITNEMSLSYKSKDSTIGFPKLMSNKDSFSPMHREDFKENAERVLSDFIEEITDDDSPRSRNKRKPFTEQLIERLADIISDPDQTNKEDMIRSEVTQYLRNFSMDADVPTEDSVNELTNRIKNIPFQTSTPRKRVKDRDVSLFPKRDGSRPSISSIHFEDNVSTVNITQSQVDKSIEEQKYKNELTDVIERWISELPINLNATSDNGFKETMINELVGDIIDRHKYLQLNPDAKTSDQEELEHLKYQVFRWLNKLLDVNDMALLLPKTESLMNRLKDVQVPLLVNPSGKRRVEKLDKAKMPDSLDALQDEISLRLEGMPSNLFTLTDSNFKERMIRELAENIHQLKYKNQEKEIGSEISKWINKVVKDTVRQKLEKVADALNPSFQNEDFTDTSNVLTQDSSQFIEENLTGAIMDWLKDLPLYQRRSPQEKRAIRTLIPELDKDLKRVFAIDPTSTDANTDELVIHEIFKHLKKLPLDKEQKTDDDFLRRAANQLLHYLKGLQMFQDISNRRDPPPDEYLTANIEDWINSLLIHSKMSPSDMRLFDNLWAEFLPKLKRLRLQDDQTVKDEIKKFLLMLPIDNAEKRYEQFINEKVEQLFNHLQAVPVECEERKRLSNVKNNEQQQTIPSRSNCLVNKSEESLIKETKLLQDPVNKTSLKTKDVDALFQHIEQWCQDLPVDGEDTSKNATIKQNIAKRLLHKIGQLNMDPQIFNDDFLYEDLLQDELDNLLYDICEDTKFMSRSAKLKKNLIDKVNDSRKKIQCEVAGQAYLQQLREAVNKTVLQLADLSAEAQAYFEIVKDNLADAFINLHYVGNDEELKKYKNRIIDEVNNFCNNYLKRHPATPVDSIKLNRDLYSALRNVPLPNENSIRVEVEIVKTKDEISDWLKELPLREQTEPEKSQTNKIISVLAKKVHDIEIDKKNYSGVDSDDIMRKEIIRYLNKLALKPGNSDIGQMADKLIGNLKNTESSRRMSLSKRHCIDADLMFEGSKSYDHNSLPKKTPLQDIYSVKNMPQDVNPIPPSTLSTEDRAHLQRIRERSSSSPMFRISPQRPSIDTYVNPPTADASTRTENRPSGTQPANPALAQQASINNIQPYSYRPGTYNRMQVGSQVDIPPQVIVKEYFWDSTVNPRLLETISQPSPPQYHEYRQYRVPDQSYVSTQSQEIPSPAQQSFVQQPSSYSYDQNQQTSGSSPSGLSQYPPPSYTAPQPSVLKPPCSSSVDTPQENQCSRPGMRKAWDNSQPCPGRQEMPGASHVVDTETGARGSFRTMPGQRVRVTRLGSLDDCQESRCRKPKRTERIPEDDDFCWSSVRFPENDSEFWGRHRLVLTSDEDIEEPYTREREKREEKVRCRCSQRILTKRRRRPNSCRVPPCQSSQDTSMKHCPKCCGIHCPYPSYLYFRE